MSYGTPASAQLVNALDLRLQEQTMPRTGLVAVARLMGVGDVLLRNDLQYERYNTPRPRSLLDLVASMPGPTPVARLAYAAALVGTTVYVIGFIASWWLPEPGNEEIE